MRHSGVQAGAGVAFLSTTLVVLRMMYPFGVHIFK